MWMANALFTVIGVIGLVRVQHSGGSARGGDFSEVIDTVRTWFAQRFHRGDVSRSRQNGNVGYGLGLAIVRSLVVAHGGWVEVVSDVGGAKFRICLAGWEDSQNL